MTETRTPDTAATGGLAAENRPAESTNGDTATARTHTAGPWRIQFFHGVPDVIVGANGDDIASLYASDGMDEPTAYPVEANAALICAAPTMYEALVTVEAILSIVPPRNSMREYVAALHQVRAALDACKSGTEGRNEGSLQTVTAESSPLVTLQNQTPQ